ncbi:unnamed protein product [Adineta ricciae]|uniref:Uncharacterized protein n=1 Tax=Adineta ricciae TaxID=249248 RepID=A0A815WIE9_ADIRI|nr:unnamed protein product [Adineta ricciae]
MNNLNDPMFLTSYQFSRWSPSLIRPSNHSTSIKSTLQPESRSHSPPPLYQPASTPDLDEESTTVSSQTPVRIKSAMLAVPLKANFEEIPSNSFAKQSHERRKIAQERKLRKQQAQKYAHIDSDNWFHLRQTSAPLKRLIKTDECLIDLQTMQLNYEKLKHTILQEPNRKSESGCIRPRTSVPKSTSFTTQPRLSKRTTDVYSKPVFEAFIVASKPLHSLQTIDNTHSPKTRFKFTKPPSSAPPRMRSSPLSTTTYPPCPSAPILPPTTNEILPVIEEQPSIVSTQPLNRPKTASQTSIKSTIKLQNQIPRCRSAIDTKPSNKSSPRFILITDDEHRIECWYHRYPFIISTDFLQSFQSKSSSPTISAYFIDENSQSLDLNKISKGHLQDKPFHRDYDWKKYDLILISDKIYQNTMIYLQPIVNLVGKSSGKPIQIHQVNQEKDLKTQVTYFSIDGFLFRGITPSEHYYHFSQSFPQALLIRPKSTLTFEQCYNSHRSKINRSSGLLFADGKYSLTCLSSKLSTSRTFLSNQSSTKTTPERDTLFQSTPIDLDYLENEIRKIQERIAKHRLKHNRPKNLSEMTSKQILEEKTNVQQELLRFENKYSKPTQSEQKKIVKPLYDYYRQLKRLVENQQQS